MYGVYNVVDILTDARSRDSKQWPSNHKQEAQVSQRETARCSVLCRNVVTPKTTKIAVISHYECIHIVL